MNWKTEKKSGGINGNKIFLMQALFFTKMLLSRMKSKYW